MPTEPDYTRDVEFSRLIRRDPGVDLQQAALEVARDEYPDIHVDTYVKWFDDVAATLRPRLYKAANEAELLAVLVNELCGDRGFYGTPDAFRDTRCSYLNRVIETGRGLPLTLSMIYMGVAERLQIDLAGVAAPMHFLCRIETEDGPLFLDPFTHGRILNERQCVDWLQRVSQLEPDMIRRSLGPADPRAIMLRMLHNVKALFAQQERWDSLWKVQHRLCALLPGNWQERRDLGMVSLQAHRPVMSVALLSDCLKSCGDESDKSAIQHALDQAQAMLARLN